MMTSRILRISATTFLTTAIPAEFHIKYLLLEIPALTALMSICGVGMQ